MDREADIIRLHGFRRERGEAEPDSTDLTPLKLNHSGQQYIRGDIFDEAIKLGTEAVDAIEKIKVVSDERLAQIRLLHQADSDRLDIWSTLGREVSRGQLALAGTLYSITASPGKSLRDAIDDMISNAFRDRGEQDAD